jgi:sortase A
MSFDRIQFDPNSVPLRSDLRILVTIRTIGQPDQSIYFDSNGEQPGINRTKYISETNQPGLLKQDEVSVVSNWPRFGGPHIVVLPEGQRLLLGKLPEGTTVEVALWRKFIMAQTFSNRILVAATPNGIAAFQPRPGATAAQRSEQIYRDSKQEQDVQQILNSIPEVPIKSAILTATETSAPPPYIDVSTEPEKTSPAEKEIEEISAQTEDVQPRVEVEPLPKPVDQVQSVVDIPEKDQKSVKLRLALSDALITFAIFAIMFAAYQTVWSGFVSQVNISGARSEVESKWIQTPLAEPMMHQGFALAYIPRLKDKVWKLPITKGVDSEDLISGLGQYPENALPGEKGNFALAGHRATYGEPFANIDQLKQDDEVIIQTADNWYVYRLIMDELVEPDETWVLEENPGGIVNKTGIEAMITLTTCHPRWGSTQRWIWWGVLTEVRPIDQVPESVIALQEDQVQ